jgi:large subunit ribosomal protein L6
MKIEKIEETIALPAGVTAAYGHDHVLHVKGPKGELSRLFFDPKVAMSIRDGGIVIISEKATLREKKTLFTFKSHAKNMVKGVHEGYTYRLKVCSGHFPMTASVKGATFEIKNFIGEKVPRVMAIKKGAEVKVDGEHVTVTGFDKELVSQVAADIEQLSRRPGYDTRVFQDGIFIVEKDGKKMQ